MNLHERQKEYEAVSQNYLIKKLPVMIRLDGVAFHTVTKLFVKPFDSLLGDIMMETTQYLVDNIQGCVMGYTQSDEISLVLQDYRKEDTDAWFGYNVQKLVSVSAKMASVKFTKLFMKKIYGLPNKEDRDKYMNVLDDNTTDGFDSRCWNLPFHEVNNYFIDRQTDAERNSINLCAQQFYTDKELQGIKKNALQDKMFTEKGFNWNDLPVYQKRGGVCIPKNLDFGEFETPIFSKQPDFVNDLVTCKIGLKERKKNDSAFYVDTEAGRIIPLGVHPGSIVHLSGITGDGHGITDTVVIHHIDETTVSFISKNVPPSPFQIPHTIGIFEIKNTRVEIFEGPRGVGMGKYFFRKITQPMEGDNKDEA